MHLDEYIANITYCCNITIYFINSALDKITQYLDFSKFKISYQNAGNNFLPRGNDLEEITNKIMEIFVNYVRPFIEPVKVDYSNELLATQIYGISIALFMLSIIIFLMLIFFILNTLIFVYSDKLLNYFKNKYIL